MTINLPTSRRTTVLTLGAESAGVFAVYHNGSIFMSKNFGDILVNTKFLRYKRAVLAHLAKEKIKPNVIITDLHPLYNSSIFGEELAKKYSTFGGSAVGGKITKLIKVQHHIAHIFSSVGDRLLLSTINYQLPTSFIGIAADGTGYGLDGNIWGGEVFKSQMSNVKCQKIRIERIGSLEEQTMIGGDLAVREPARMLIAILAKLKNQKPKTKTTDKKSKTIKTKNDIYRYVRKFYTRNEFEALYNQLEQNFNCQKTTSTGRILDAVSVLLGFAGNERKYKHEATKLLEKNSSKPYPLEPKITSSVIASESPAGDERGNPADVAINTGLLRRFAPRNDKRWILQTTPLFEYLIKNIHKDKKRLAATAQLYIAKGFYKIAQKLLTTYYSLPTVFAAGGMANNKIISSYLENRGVYVSKKIPRGDEGIAVGQIMYYLLSNLH